MEQPQPPADRDEQAEQTILGTMMLQPATIPTVLDQITPDDYHNTLHGQLHRTIVDNHRNNQPTDPLAIARTVDPKLLQKLGGAAALHTMLASVPTAANIHYYLGIVAGHARLRNIHLVGAQLHQIAGLDPEQQNQQLTDLLGRLTTLAQQTRQATGTRIHTKPAAEFTLRPVDWLWDARIPLGEICLVAGREGTGKSTLLAWMAAAITRGELPGQYYGHPRGVLYAAQEDSWERTVAPRLHAAGADMYMVHHMAVETRNHTRRVILPNDLPHLPEVIERHKACVLMCDPILSMIPDNTNPNHATEVRAVLEPLQQMADTCNIAIIGLAHLNKREGADVGTNMAGTRAWLEVARAALAVAKDKTAEDYTVVVSQIKNNLGRDDLSHLTYTIVNQTITIDDGRDLNIGTLQWTGETDTTAEEILQRRPATNHRDSDDTPANRGDNTLRILTWVDQQGRAVSIGEIAEQFHQIRRGTLDSILSRSVSRGDLTKPTSGMYSARRVEPAPPVVYEQPPLASCPVCHGPMEPGSTCERCD